MPKMEVFGEKNNHFRLIIPGIDGGSAVWFEAEILHESIEACEELLKRVITELPKTEFRETI